MELSEKQRMALLASIGPMGLGAIDYVPHCGRRPSLLVDTVLNLPQIPGGKKLIYNHIDMPLTAIDAFGEKGRTDPLFAELDKICKAHKGLWNAEAVKYLLANAKAV